MSDAFFNEVTAYGCAAFDSGDGPDDGGATDSTRADAPTDVGVDRPAPIDAGGGS
jgi:hypothetical protein